MEILDFDVFVSTAYRDCFEGEVFRSFQQASSDVDRVASCSQLPIWSDGAVCRFIQQSVLPICRGPYAKSDEQSVSWRRKGNACFKKGLYNKALACYTQNVLTAPCYYDSGSVSISVELATAFGNRSAALYRLGKYELAFQECDRAMIHGYPKASFYKLLQRKGQCLVEMGRGGQAIEVFREALLALDEAVNLNPDRKDFLKSETEKLLSRCSQSSIQEVPTIHDKLTKSEVLAEVSDQLANASRSVSLRCSKDRGRYLVAAFPVSAGELVIKEIPYSAVLLPDHHTTHCYQCCKRSWNPIACPRCIDVQYCSDQCLQSAQNSYHWLECGMWDQLTALGIQAWLSLRLMLQAKSWCNIRHIKQEMVAQGPSSSDCVKHFKTDPQTSERRNLRGHSEPHEVEKVEGASSHGTRREHHKREPQTSSEINRLRHRAAPRDCEAFIVEGTSSHCQGITNLNMDPQIIEMDRVREKKKTTPYEEEVCRIDGTSPAGCGRGGCYRSDYRAVYHLMPHTENHSAKELFNMTMTALLLSKCIQGKLNGSAQWKRHLSNAVASSTAASALCSKPESLDERQRNTQETPQNEVTVRNSSRCSDDSEVSACKLETRCDNCGLDDSYFCPPVVHEVADILLRHMQQLKCNTHAVTAILSEEKDCVLDASFDPTKSQLKSSNVNSNSGTSTRELEDNTPVGTRVDRRSDTQVDRVVDTTQQVRVATAVYPTVSLLNHACQPNVIASFDGSVLTMRASRDIEAGEEILHCYGPHAKHMSQDDRQRALQRQYFFTCTCHACTMTPVDELQTRGWSISFACSKCSHPLMQREGKKKVGVCSNPKCRNTQNLRELSKEKDRAANLFKLSQHFMQCKHIEECLSILHQCYNIQRGILYRYHESLAETQDCLAKCYSVMGDFKKAGKYLRLSVATVEKKYGSESIELANELHKLAQVLFNGCEVQDTLVIVDRAIKLFMLHYGSSHQDVKELTQMRTFLMSL